MSIRQNIEDVIHDLAYSLDEEQFERYLAHCSDDFEYTISVDTPELGQAATWLHHDKSEMKALMKDLKQHIRLKGQFLRQLGSPSVDLNRKAKTARTRTSFVTVHTELDGASRIYAVGRYEDTFSWEGDTALLESRVVKLQTRDLGPGSHVPI